MARPGWRGLASGALAGLLAAAVALGVAELIAGITGPLGSPVVAVGGAAIDMTPIPVKDFAIVHFGSHDKTALISGIFVLLAIFAVVIGVLARRWLAAGLAGLTIFGALGVSAALTRPTAGATDVLPTLAGVAAGMAALILLIQVGTPDQNPPIVPGRRGFLAAAAGMAVVAAVAGAGGDLLLRRFSATTARNQVRLPAAARAAPPLPAGAKLDVSGISSFYTPNNSFYRVDTDLVLPQVSPDQWTLRISGMVDRPVELSFADLLRQPLTEADITLVCVSNEVGGPYAGNARWLGASLPALLRRAGLRSGADQVLSTSVDGMTISTPVSAIMDGRNALLAVGMNGQPLPIAHGFPARMVVPGLYGYTSATKWITKLELTTFAAQQGLLDTARLRGAGADQDRITDRRAEAAVTGAQGPGRRGRSGLGPAPRHLGGRGQRRQRRVARGPARRGRRHRYLAAVGVELGRHPGTASAAGARDGRYRRDADQ